MYEVKPPYGDDGRYFTLTTRDDSNVLEWYRKPYDSTDIYVFNGKERHLGAPMYSIRLV